jgi:hypothetical protein
MPRYFFSVSDSTWLDEAAEDLPNDEAAKRRADEIANEINRNRNNLRIIVFDSSGKLIA